MKRIFRYIKGTLDLQLTFRGPITAITGYTDANWAGDQDTRRSTSGFIFNLGSRAIRWSSKRQPAVALSGCEAKYMGQTQAVKEAVWLKSLLDRLSPPSHTDSISSTTTNPKLLPTRPESNTLPDTDCAISLPSINSFVASESYLNFVFSAVVICCDNQGAIALAIRIQNPTLEASKSTFNGITREKRSKMAPSSLSLSRLSNKLPMDLKSAYKKKVPYFPTSSWSRRISLTRTPTCAHLKTYLRPPECPP